MAASWVYSDTVRDFKRMRVWGRSHELTLAVYEATGRFPRGEEFGVKAQLRRAAASIPSNLAEGAGRSSERDFARFVTLAMASANEVEYQLILSRDLGLLPPDASRYLLEECATVRRMLV